MRFFILCYIIIQNNSGVLKLFIHCADLHIGAGRAEARQADFYNAFIYIAKQAVQKNAEFVLISGDLFDKRELNPESLRQAYDALNILKQADIPVFAIEGNHDRAIYTEQESWMDYLDASSLIKLLKTPREGILQAYSDGGNVCYFNGCRIIGIGYAGARTNRRIEELIQALDGFNGKTVLLLHAPVDRMHGADYAFLQSKALSALKDNVDYIALGHIHTRYEIDGFMFNPGAPECVKVDEAFAGEKGFYCVDLVNGIVEFERYPHRTALKAVIDTTGLDTSGEVYKKIMDWAESNIESLEGAMLLIKLTGKPEFDMLAIDCKSLEKDVAERYGCFSCEINVAVNSTYASYSGNYGIEQLETAAIESLIDEKGISNAKELAALILSIKRLERGEGFALDALQLIEAYGGGML